MTTKITWNDENTARLVELAGESPVSQATLTTVAEELGTTARSIGSKLRNMNYEVDKASAKASAWTEAQEAALSALVTANSGTFTYAEIAKEFENGAFNAKQVQGKILSMELFSHVRKTEKTSTRTYTEAEEAEFIALVNAGASIEALVAKFGRSAPSIRGKALSLLKTKEIEAMPVQEVSSAKENGDVLEGVDVASLTVAEIAETTGKSERGIKSMLSRRGITAKDYDGAAKREKLDNKD